MWWAQHLFSGNRYIRLSRSGHVHHTQAHTPWHTWHPHTRTHTPRTHAHVHTQPHNSIRTHTHTSTHTLTELHASLHLYLVDLHSDIHHFVPSFLSVAVSCNELQCVVPGVAVCCPGMLSSIILFCLLFLGVSMDSLHFLQNGGWWRKKQHYDPLQHNAIHCSILQHTATYCNTIQYERLVLQIWPF